jgi:hypothetical protein
MILNVVTRSRCDFSPWHEGGNETPMTDHIITINNSEGHDPPLPFMVVDRFGLFVDLSKVHGQLFDPTVLKITWGERTMDGRTFGQVMMKNGNGRAYWDPELMEPYLRVWKIAKGNHDLSEALAEQRRKEAAEAERAEALRRDQERLSPPKPAPKPDTGPDIMIRHPGWFPTML